MLFSRHICCRLIQNHSFLCAKAVCVKWAVLKGKCLKCPAASFCLVKSQLELILQVWSFWTSAVL